jgi:MFS family permease
MPVNVSTTSRSATDAQTTAATNGRNTLALGLILLAQLMVVLDMSIVTLALPSSQRAVHFSPVGLQWVISAYALSFGGLLLLGG